MNHHMSLQNEPFTAIASGQKTIELRLYDKKRQAINLGDTITFQHALTGDALSVQVIGLLRYPSFSELIADFPSQRFGSKDQEAMKSLLQTFYSKEQEARNGVLGIKIKLLSESL